MANEYENNQENKTPEKRFTNEELEAKIVYLDSRGLGDTTPAYQYRDIIKYREIIDLIKNTI